MAKLLSKGLTTYQKTKSCLTWSMLPYEDEGGKNVS
jgi:hypothetical protein